MRGSLLFVFSNKGGIAVRKWIRKIGVLALALVLVLALAGCGTDVGIIGGADGPTRIIVTDSSEETADSQAALPVVSEPGGPSGAADGGGGQSNEAQSPAEEDPATTADGAVIDEDGEYNSAEDVALYLHTYGRLPKNYITKNEARDLGWSGGSVERYAPGCAIGGDTFGNREGLLPKGKYHECDIDTVGKDSRGAKRLIYSDDGRIYCTEDHYETFILLYGEE